MEEFCKVKGITISGICDVVNTDVGDKTDSGNQIFLTDYVKEKADVILASNRFAYEDLSRESIRGKVIDFEQYMPWG